jgi:hypothetical protein
MESKLATKGVVTFEEWISHKSFFKKTKEFELNNLIFNWPREQYSKLDRGETPDSVNACYLTLVNTQISDPSLLVVPNEANRIPYTARGKDPNDPKTTILRFFVDFGQFIGSFSTAVLIGGPLATSSPGTGKIISAVNNIKDDQGAAINRSGSTLHTITWRLHHLDISEA